MLRPCALPAGFIEPCLPTSSSNIYPREVEEVLLAHGKVREVSVIGRRDRDWGEVVVAYVVGEASGERDAGRQQLNGGFPVTTA
jgi:acyl-CoA synthetase (AMP-forming)/AMP-acid ligase II